MPVVYDAAKRQVAARGRWPIKMGTPNAIELALCTLGIFPYGYIADEPDPNGSPARDVPDGEYPQCAQLPRTLNKMALGCSPLIGQGHIKGEYPS